MTHEPWNADRPEATPSSVWPSAPPQDPPLPLHGRRRRAGALLVAVALAGAVAGGSAAVRVQDEPVPAVAASVVRSSVVTARAVAVDGTPQSAAAVIGPSVVTLTVSGPGGSGTGSGVVVREDGYVLTNAHVVEAAVGGGTVRVELSDGTLLDATIVGTDPTSDLAVVRVEQAEGLVAALFADSDGLAVGQAVLAVGAPLGLSNTVTQGIVSTLHRPVRTGDDSTSQSVIDAVQTDAAINPGNSGGALVDLAGQVVGVPSAIATTSSTSGSIGVGFAIPSNDVAEVADEIIATGAATHAQIGVGLGSDDGTSGAVLSRTTAGGPADDAGLQAGDVVVAVADRQVTDADSLVVAVRSHDPGASVEVVYRRGGQERTATVVLGSAG